MFLFAELTQVSNIAGNNLDGNSQNLETGSGTLNKCYPFPNSGSSLVVFCTIYTLHIRVRHFLHLPAVADEAEAA